MNRVQTVIAEATGLSTVLDRQQKQLAELAEQNNQVIIDNALMQRAIEDIDYLNLFEVGGSIQDIVPMNTRATLNRLRRMRHENPLAKQAVSLCLRFTLGKGIEYTIAPETDNAKVVTPPDPAKPNLRVVKEPIDNTGNDRLSEIFDAFWNDPDNQVVLTGHKYMKEWLDHNYTDGERFLVCFTAPSAPYVKMTYVPLEEIDLIIYHPDNRAIPLYYRRKWRELRFEGDPGQWVPDGDVKEMYYLDWAVTEGQLSTVGTRINLPASKIAPTEERIYHSMPIPLMTRKGKRGISEFFASRNWFNVFKEFMEDRASINKAATSIAFKRKVKGGPAAVASFTNKLGDLPVGYDAQQTELRKLTRPAAAGIYDSNNAVEMEWMKTDTGAINAREDARLLLMGGGAGVATNITYFGEGGDANLATAQAMELPMVKSYEDWQEFVNETLKEITRFVLQQAFSDPTEVVKQSGRIAFHFPPIVTQDVVKYMTAWVQMVTSIAPGNPYVRKEAIRGALTTMGVPNIDRVLGDIMDAQNTIDAEKKAQADALRANLANNPPPGIGDGGRDQPGFPAKPPIQGALSSDKRIAKGKPPQQFPGARPA